MGKSSKTKVGHHYRLALHLGLVGKPIDAFLEFRAADKPAWQGALTESGRISINEPELFGGEKDQGGIVSDVDVMFGEEAQVPNAYLVGLGRDQTAAWRGFTTLVFAGGRYGAMSPFAQKPSFKVRKILRGWDGEFGEEACWYPEKAQVPISQAPAFTTSWRKTADSPHTFTSPSQVPSWSTDPADYTVVDTGAAITWPTGVGAVGIAWLHIEAPGGVPVAFHLDVKTNYDDSGQVIGTHNVIIGEATPPDVVSGYPREEGVRVIVPKHGGPFSGRVAFACVDGRDIETGEILGSPSNHRMLNSSLSVIAHEYAMNAAHALVYVRTDSEKGRESIDNIDDANLRAAADQLYSEGFGLCWEYDPERDTPDSFSEQVCRIIGGSFERSVVDGKWRLQLLRADYDFGSLPILSDSDGAGAGLILSFNELPSTLDSAVNIVGVRYFNVERKEQRTVWARAPGLIRQFGEIRQLLEYKWIPTATLAARVAERELRTYITPSRSYEISTDPSYRTIERYQTVRLQAHRYGIADMVCVVGDKQMGTLRSGAIRWVLTEHVYGFADTQLVEVEDGVDTRPPQVPVPVEHARVFEAPFVDVCANLPRAELEALPDHVGYLLGVAARPAHGLDYGLFVEPDGGDYAQVASADWCPTATVVAAHPREHGPTVVALADGQLLDRVAVGMAVLWDDEWCRLDAIDTGAMTATLARACADTVPWPHAAGSRLWFRGDAIAADVTEYTDGETIAAKVLPSTGSQRLPLASAAALPLTFDGRQARPYPPAGVLLNGEAYPSTVVGDVEITAAHRDRLLQDDQLVDQTAADIGPEPGTTYVVRNVNALTEAETYYVDGITSFPHVVPSGDLVASNRLEIYSVRDGLESWQRVVVPITVGAVLLDGHGMPITDNYNDPIRMR